MTDAVRRAVMFTICLALSSLAPVPGAAESALVIGSKRFTESYILGEVALATVVAAGERGAVHRQGLGNTGIVFEALKSGAIDLYPDYTGTIGRELLHIDATDPDSLDRALAAHGLGVAIALGFENTYAIAVRAADAKRLALNTIGDLAAHPALHVGLSPEFLNRADGWPGVVGSYRLPQRATVLDHGLAYEAIGAGRIDVMDIYSTDARIARLGLRVLVDDHRFFPEYQAVFVYRLDLAQRFPRAWAALQRLEGRIDANTMIAMNAAAELDGRSFAQIAADFVRGVPPAGSVPRSFATVLFGDDFWRLTREHLLLVGASVLAACAIGIPLGIAATRSSWIGQPLLAAVGLIQTIPSIALLAFLIPVTGAIGTWPAAIALFLYSLLPIVGGTHAGLTAIAPSLRESALALGLNAGSRLRLVELPLAAHTVLDGIKTSTVIGVGTATIAAFIGAGGYGERITAGLAVNDNALLLAGALPAAALALLVHVAFELGQRWLPRRH